MKFRNFYRVIMPLLAIIVLSACQPTIHNQGKKIDQDELNMVKKGVHTKQEVEQILGSPSTVSTFSDMKWYYIYKKTTASAFLKPEIVEQDVVVLEFDSNNVLAKITILGEKDGKQVDYVERITPTAGHSSSFLNQVFGDFGRVAKKDSPIK